MGLRAATGNLRIQLPLIAEEFPEVANSYHGTINLLLDCPLLVLAPDHRTEPISWHRDYPQGEVFDLLRVKLEAPTGAAAVLAWLFIPHGSPHRKNLRLHEVIAPRLKLDEGARCLIRMNRNVVQLPYQSWPVIVVV